MDKHCIMGIHITDRLHHAVEVQRALTDFGGTIKTRLGLHEIGKRQSSPNGLVILEILGEDQCRKLAQRLKKIDGIEVKTMIFDHP